VTYWYKIAKFLYPTIFSATAGGDSVKISWRRLMLIKLEWLGYRMVKKTTMTISERYGRTDGQTELLYQYRASVCWRAIKTEWRATKHSAQDRQRDRHGQNCHNVYRTCMQTRLLHDIIEPSKQRQLVNHDNAIISVVFVYYSYNWLPISTD